MDAVLPDELRAKAQADREQIKNHPEGDGWGGE